MKQSHQIIVMSILVMAYVVLALWVGDHMRREGNDKLMESQLRAYSEVVKSAYSADRLEPTIELFPSDIRVSIISESGAVVYDSVVDDLSQLERHDGRPELQAAHYSGEGSHHRTSVSTSETYLYYARFDGQYYYRVAMPMSVSGEGLGYLSQSFVLVSLVLVVLLAVWCIWSEHRRRHEMDRLKGLVGELSGLGTGSYDVSAFPHTEYGDVSRMIVKVLNQKEEDQHAIEAARERLITHFKLSNIGIAIYNAHGEPEFTNSHFIQYANLLSAHPITDLRQLIDDPKMVAVKRFLTDPYDATAPVCSTTVHQDSSIFEVKALRSANGGYEITIANITEQEKARVLKQEMTGNITHEIRTPLSSIRGYLETLRFMNLTEEKRREFLDKAYKQCIRLSEMMEDIRLISKLDEESSPFDFQAVDLHMLAEEIRIAYKDKLEESGATFVNKLPDPLLIQGNSSLLYSVLQNMVENSLRYGGEEIELVLECYLQDDSYLYLSYHDTGRGLPEKHMNRIFERFYRVDAGRTRAGGGSGLGLSIVKNAIHIHSGQIQARTHHTGGLELLFTLHK